MIGGAPLPVSAPRVIVYHQCAIAATGSVLGPHDALAYWWAGRDGIRIVPAGPMDTAGRTMLEQAILEALGSVPDAARRAQDDAAEAPDL